MFYVQGHKSRGSDNLRDLTIKLALCDMQKAPGGKCQQYNYTTQTSTTIKCHGDIVYGVMGK